MRVLLIEDDLGAARSLELMLTAGGAQVDRTPEGEEGLELCRVYDYDLILLDLQLPDMSGVEVLRRLRAGRIGTPVVIVSGETEIPIKVRALAGGADDYLTKPFDRDELLARIHAVIRRAQGHAQSVIAVGDLVLNLDQKTVEVGGARVPLTGKEYQMVELMMLRKGAIITKDMFLNHLYGGLDEPELKIIDVFMCKLRKKLIDAGCTPRVRTVWGRGYVLCDASDEDAYAA